LPTGDAHFTMLNTAKNYGNGSLPESNRFRKILQTFHKSSSTINSFSYNPAVRRTISINEHKNKSTNKRTNF